MSTRNVHETILKKLHESKALEAMIETQSEKLKSYRSTDTKINGITKQNLLIGKVKIYISEEEARLSYHSKNPISIVKMTKNIYGILYFKNGSNRGEISFLIIEKENNNITNQHGLKYWKWSLTKKYL